jgi:hypothetical protein
MNYSKIYNLIVYDPRNHFLKKGKYETHHIVPKSFGGTDDKDNLVKLTHRQHFICHWLLWKMSTGKNRIKMLFAFNMMINGQQGKKINANSRMFSQLKIEMKNHLRGNQHAKNYKHSKEAKHRISMALTKRDRTGIGEKISQVLTGRKLSDEHKRKMIGNKNAIGNRANRGKKLTPEQKLSRRERMKQKAVLIS